MIIWKQKEETISLKKLTKILLSNVKHLNQVMVDRIVHRMDIHRPWYLPSRAIFSTNLKQTRSAFGQNRKAAREANLVVEIRI